MFTTQILKGKCKKLSLTEKMTIYMCSCLQIYNIIHRLKKYHFRRPSL